MHYFSRSIVALIATAWSAAFAQSPQTASQTTTQLPRTVRPTHYDVAIEPDAAALTFAGKVAIAIDVLQPTTSIALNALDLSFTSVRLSGGAGTASFAAPRIQVDRTTQTATFTFERPIQPGAYQLALDYSGKIGTQAVGLFSVDYDTTAGRKRGLYTQFEAPHARRMIPSWDEPAYKATFTLQAIVPTEQIALSNMPATRRTDLPGGRSLVQFERSPKMSTYLLFFAMGEFDRSALQVGPTDVAVVTRKGVASQAAFALEASGQVLREFDDYFGTPYPLPKLDNIAAPGRGGFSAMENWGAILYFEYALLLDPTISTQSDKQNVFGTVAHEIAHQWFGNLVTMSWWDDLWLNEGFASWMGNRITERLHPEWNTALSAVSSRDAALHRDSYATTHPIVQHVETVEQMVQAFDGITYSKGQAVIRMLEGYVGEVAWREGVRRYINAHTYGNTQSDDLWRAIQAAAAQPILDIAHDFTLQPGVPLIRVEADACAQGRTTVRLTQGEFSKDRPDKKPLAWRVPVIVKSLDGTEAVREVVTGKTTLSVPGCAPVVVNAGQSGYYRTLYSPAQFAAIAKNFASLASIDQLGILADAWALGIAGQQPAPDFLALATATPTNADPKIWGRIAGVLAALDQYYDGDPKRQAAFRKFAIARLAPIFAQVGWTAATGESDATAILRNGLIQALGALGDSAVVAEARRRYESKDPLAIPGPLRKTILAIVARHTDAATWDRLRAAASAEKTPLVKDTLYSSLAMTQDRTLARRALDLALTPEPGATNSFAMIATVSRLHPDMTFDFALANLPAVDAKIDPTARSVYLPNLASSSADPAMIDKVSEFARAHLPEGSRRAAETVVAGIKDRIKVRREQLPAIDAWLAHNSR